MQPAWSSACSSWRWAGNAGGRSPGLLQLALAQGAQAAEPQEGCVPVFQKLARGQQRAYARTQVRRLPHPALFTVFCFQ